LSQKAKAVVDSRRRVRAGPTTRSTARSTVLSDMGVDGPDEDYS
jgi:hypothetical protein